MGELTPVAFDIETSGLDPGAVVTNETTTPTTVAVVSSEQALLETVHEFVADSIDGDSHHLTAYNGETWNGGFDLPLLRSACHRNGVEWPFGVIAYADTMDAIQRFDTGDTQDLAGVYDHLIGDDHCDPSTTAGVPSPPLRPATGYHF